MSDHKREEYEQSEEVRKWLKDNMQTLVTGVAGGLALLYGWQFFQQWQAEQQQAAGEAFYHFEQAFEQKDRAQAEAALTALKQDFPRSLYTSMATMEYARLQMDQDPAEALKTLQSLQEKSPDEAMANLLAYRVARLQWQTGDNDAALQTLAGIESPAYASMVAETRGDIYAESGKLDAARTAYQQALDNLDPTQAGSRPLLELKLDNLGKAEKATASEPAAEEQKS